MAASGGSTSAPRRGTWLRYLFLVVGVGFLGAMSPHSPLADAVMTGDRERVRALLAEGVDVNEAHGDGMTALHWAAERGDHDVAELLLGKGADVAAATRLGAYVPLHLASRNGHSAVVRLLLEAGSDPNARTTTGDVTPLHLASAAGEVEGVQALLEFGADPNARETAWGQTPLMFAATGNRTEAIRALLEHGADPAVTARVLDIEEWNDVTQRVRGGASLEEARAETREAREERERRLMEEEADEEGFSPASYAQQVGAYGGLTALLMASREGHAEGVRVLLEGGAEIDQVSAGDGTSPILIAVINGRFDLAMELLELGADPTIASHAGAQPLYATINKQWIPDTRHPQPRHFMYQETSYLELMEALLQAGVDPNARLGMELWYTDFGRSNLGVDRAGATPFWRAAHALDVEAMKLLVEYGAEPNIPTKAPPLRGGGFGPGEQSDPSGLEPVEAGGSGHFPIHAAAGVGYARTYNWDHRHAPDGWMPAMRYLVEVHGADVNQRDHLGLTALHGAAARGDDELIRYLVERGADVTAVARSGLTTADAANAPYQRAQVHERTVRLLESLGAHNNQNCVGC